MAIALEWLLLDVQFAQLKTNVNFQVSYCCQKFSKFLVEEIMRQYNNVNSGELKNLSTLLVEILVSDDYEHFLFLSIN